MKKLIIILMLGLASRVNAQTLSDQLADSAMGIWKDSLNLISQDSCSADLSLALEGIDMKWRLTAHARYFQYMQKTVDTYLSEAKSYKDSISMGYMALTLYKTTGKEKYLNAATALYDRWKSASVNSSFKCSSDIYKTAAFHASYAAMVKDTGAFNRISDRFDNDPADRGALGWYAMALVNVLDDFPENHPRRKELIYQLKKIASDPAKYQDPMLLHAVQKAIRNGWLPDSYSPITAKAFAGIQQKLIWRDPELVAAFLPAATEMELAAIPKTGRGKTVILDNYFNHELRKAPATGQMESFHYLWPERDINGYSFFRQSFDGIGAKTIMLSEAPSALNLKKAQIYIIVDPDTEKESTDPNYVEAQHIKAIADWVSSGGVLVMFLNDSSNAEFTHFNKLSGTFGIHFNENSKNKVTGSKYEMGAIMIPDGHPIFKTARKVYIKELSTLKLNPPAVASLIKDGDIIIATAKYGKGTVFAVGDPWFYNEYTDGRKLPAEFENFKAANDLAKWLVQQIP